MAHCTKCGSHQDGMHYIDCPDMARLPRLPCPVCAKWEEEINAERMKWSNASLEWNQLVEKLESRLALLEKVAEAAKFLAPVLNEAVNRDDYRGIFLLAHNHGLNYEGPTFERELQNFNAALAAAGEGK